MPVCNFLLVARYFLFVVCNCFLLSFCRQQMLTKWNLVDEEKVTNNLYEIRVYDFFFTSCNQIFSQDQYCHK